MYIERISLYPLCQGGCVGAQTWNAASILVVFSFNKSVYSTAFDFSSAAILSLNICFCNFNWTCVTVCVWVCVSVCVSESVSVCVWAWVSEWVDTWWFPSISSFIALLLAKHNLLCSSFQVANSASSDNLVLEESASASSCPTCDK